MITSPMLFMISGVVLSLLADLIPWWKTWFAELDGFRKRWVMITLLFITSVSIVSLSCWEPTQAVIIKYVVVECSEAGIIQVVEAFIYAAVGNQSTFLLSPTAGNRNGNGKTT